MERRLKKKLPEGIFKDVSPVRSRTMGAIRGKHTKSTERRLRMALIRAGIKGWVLHPSNLPGKPDFFFVLDRFALFVDGCFWHGCPRCGHIPKTRSEFWKAKIERNIERDKAHMRSLRKLGIKGTRIWEHSLKDPVSLQRLVDRLRRQLTTEIP